MDGARRRGPPRAAGHCSCRFPPRGHRSDVDAGGKLAFKKEAHSPVFLNNDNSLQEQEEITDDWVAEDEDRGKGRVIKAQVAIRLKGRKRKPKNEVGDALEFGIVMNIVKVDE